MKTKIALSILTAALLCGCNKPAQPNSVISDVQFTNTVNSSRLDDLETNVDFLMEQNKQMLATIRQLEDNQEKMAHLIRELDAQQSKP